MVAVSNFSGFVSSDCALASAAAMAPIDSLHRCMARLHVEELETDRAGFRTLGAHAVAESFFGVLWHQRLELRFRLLVLEEGVAGCPKDIRKRGPGIRVAHVHHSHRCHPGPGRFDAE